MAREPGILLINDALSGLGEVDIGFRPSHHLNARARLSRLRGNGVTTPATIYLAHWFSRSPRRQPQKHLHAWNASVALRVQHFFVHPPRLMVESQSLNTHSSRTATPSMEHILRRCFGDLDRTAVAAWMRQTQPEDGCSRCADRHRGHVQHPG